MAEIVFDHVSKQYPDGTAVVKDLNVTVHDGEFVILVGPSGCGKTTTLNLVAGLEDITSGQLLINGVVVNDISPQKRDVAMVFQSYALYPHMSVADNIAFPLRMAKMSKKIIAEKVNEVAVMLDIVNLLAKKPAQLSGGQRQRVAMGRAIVRSPHVFLMDEPLSNLDAKLRTHMRQELTQLHEKLGTTMLYVTHDQTEAMTLGDRVIVFNKGVVQQYDTPLQLYDKPKNLYVAGFFGSPAMSFIPGVLTEQGVDTPLGEIACRDRAELARSVLTSDNPAGAVIVGIRPESFHQNQPSAEATPVHMRADHVEILGADKYVRCEFSTGWLAHPLNNHAFGNVTESAVGNEVICRISGRTPLHRGEVFAVWLLDTDISLFHPVTGENVRLP